MGSVSLSETEQMVQTLVRFPASIHEEGTVVCKVSFGTVRTGDVESSVVSHL